jgi:hypothetical protein
MQTPKCLRLTSRCPWQTKLISWPIGWNARVGGSSNTGREMGTEAFSLEKHLRPLFPLLLLQQLTDRFLEDLVIAGAENTFTLHPITGGLTDHKGGGYP